MQWSSLAAAAALAFSAARAEAQTLTIADALRRADRAAYAVRIAGAQSAVAAGLALAPLKGILPSLRVESAIARTTDPLGAFGFALRQRAVTAASFDPAALNRPVPASNIATGLVMELPIFNADAWLGRRAASNASTAAAEAEGWIRTSAGYDVARAYYGALLAADRVSTLEAALASAQAHVRQAESLLRNGVVTRSDALIASVKSGDVEAALIGARSDLALSRQRLATAMGAPGDSAWALPASLPEAAGVRALAARVAADSSGHPRGDVRAATLASAAASADLERARSLYAPRINSFGRIDYNSASVPFGGTDSWTVGVMLSWAPFSGAAEIGEVQAAKGRVSAAAAAAEAAAAQASLEIRQADAALAVSLARLGIAERAVEQGVEAHRIVSRKYDGGLATVVDLFDAATIETQTRLGFAEARFRVVDAAAARLRAAGLGLASLTALDR